MKVYDAARSLANELKQSPEYTQLNASIETINANKDLKKVFEDLKTRQIELQRAQIMGEKVDSQKKSKFEELFKLAITNKEIASCFQAEYKFAQMMDEVSKIISEAVEIKK